MKDQTRGGRPRDESDSIPLLRLGSGYTSGLSLEQTCRIFIEGSNDAPLPLEALYEPSSSDTLIVSMHGALQRWKTDLPRFEWRRTLSRVEAGKLFLADPTLLLAGDLELGWYVGSQKQDISEQLAELVRTVAKLGEYKRVVCVGASGGGYASLALSRRISRSAAVVFSPQTSIAAYYSIHRKRLASAAFPTHSSFQYVEQEFPGRVNMRLLYKATEDINHVYYVQNLGDPFHHAAHYAPFAMSRGVDPETGGESGSGRATFVAERYETGHAPPSPGRFIRHLRVAHSWIYEEELMERA